MKTLFGIISIALGLLSVYLVFTSKTGYDVVLAVACLLMAVIFMCFMIMEEQKGQIERLRRGIDSYQQSAFHSTSDGRTELEIFTAADGRKYFRSK